MARSIEVNGLRKLERRLKRIDRMLRKESRRRVRQIAEQTRDRARELAPKDSLELATHIVLSDEERSRDSFSLTVASQSAHGPSVEFGRSDSAAQPHLRPAADEAAREVDNAVDRIARKMERIT